MFKISKKIMPTCLSAVWLNFCFFSLTTFPAQAACEGQTAQGTKTEDGRFILYGVGIQEITQYSGTGNSIDIDLGSGLVPTGDISFVLDATQTNSILYNFDSGYATINMNLIVSTANLGSSIANINIIESAFLPPFNLLPPSNPPVSSNLTFNSNTFITPPLSATQTSNFSGTGTIAAPTGAYRNAEFTGTSTLNFVGGGITSGLLSGIAVWYPYNPNFYSSPEFSIAINAPITGIPNPPSALPPNSPPPEVTDPVPDFPDYPTLPKPVDICPVPEPSTMLGLIGISIWGFAVINRKKLKIANLI